MFFAEENGAPTPSTFEAPRPTRACARRYRGGRRRPLPGLTATEAINAVQREEGSSVVVTAAALRKSRAPTTTTLICSDYKAKRPQKIESGLYRAQAVHAEFRCACAQASKTLFRGRRLVRALDL
ncbi:MAG: hypothetical protein ACLT98_09425 [Eggerthellaceae bacterium]